MLDKQGIYDELERVRVTFRRLVDEMTDEDLARRSNGTRWTNGQMLFHLLFGYLIVIRLLWMIKWIGRLPPAQTKPFAALLNLTTRPFDFMNYIGSVIGGRLYGRARLARSMDRVTMKLAGRLAREDERGLRRGMAYPTRWDPFFAEYMTVADLYHYPTQHFDFHAHQLSL